MDSSFFVIIHSWFVLSAQTFVEGESRGEKLSVSTLVHLKRPRAVVRVKSLFAIDVVTNSGATETKAEKASFICGDFCRKFKF